jgi:hypothetical protein
MMQDVAEPRQRQKWAIKFILPGCAYPNSGGRDCFEHAMALILGK